MAKNNNNNIQSKDPSPFTNNNLATTALNSCAETNQVISTTQCKCPKLLVVDDEPFNHLALEGLFMLQGVENIAKAFNGQDAINAMAHNRLNPTCLGSATHHHRPFKLVILDNQMPVLTGIEAARKIREMQATGAIAKETKLVLFSGDDMVNNHHQAELDKGSGLFDHILPKPVQRSEFEHFINKFALRDWFSFYRAKSSVRPYIGVIIKYRYIKESSQFLTKHFS